MAIKYGLTAGIITVVVYLLAYFINFEIFLSPKFHWATLSIYLILMYMLANKLTEHRDWSFKELVRPLFVCYLIANLVYFIFYYIMITYVDVTIYPQQMVHMKEQLTVLELEHTDFTFSHSSYILQYFQSAIGGFIMSASIAYSKKQS